MKKKERDECGSIILLNSCCNKARDKSDVYFYFGSLKNKIYIHRKIMVFSGALLASNLQCKQNLTNLNYLYVYFSIIYV